VSKKGSVSLANPVDPTENVTALVEAGMKRQDDLREKDAQHIKELMVLEAAHARELRVAESARIDAIRAVDAQAVQRAAEVAGEAVQTLAAQVPITAEAVRTSLAAALDPILKDVQELRRVQYEQQGQKAATTEQRTEHVDSRAFIFSILGVLFMISILIAPHIH
jgi:hypothetical protein